MFCLMFVPNLEVLLKVIGASSLQNFGHHVSGHRDDLGFLIALSSFLLAHQVVTWIFEGRIVPAELGHGQTET